MIGYTQTPITEPTQIKEGLMITNGIRAFQVAYRDQLLGNTGLRGSAAVSRDAEGKDRWIWQKRIKLVDTWSLCETGWSILTPTDS